MFDKLGPLEGVTKTVYWVHDDLAFMTEITDAREEGIFFAETNYVIRLKSNKHEYFINWLGPRCTGLEVSKMADAMLALVGGVYTSDMTHIRVKKGHEDDALLSWFPQGFLILDEARVPIDEWQAKINTSGTMLRV